MFVILACRVDSAAQYLIADAVALLCVILYRLLLLCTKSKNLWLCCKLFGYLL